MKINNSQEKLNNKGFTLVELIIVMAIMGIMVAVATVTVTMLDSSYVEDAERGIKDYISMGRTKSMSVVAKEWYVAIGKEDGDYYAYLYKVTEADDGTDKTSLIEKKELGAKVSISYGNEKESKMLIGTSKLQMYFNPQTGKIIKVVCDADGNGTNDIPDNTTGIGYIGIVRNDYEIDLKVFFNTGKCERE